MTSLKYQTPCVTAFQGRPLRRRRGVGRSIGRGGGGGGGLALGDLRSDGLDLGALGLQQGR